MKVFSSGFQHGAFIPEKYAFGRIDEKTKVKLADNLNPHLAWDEVPEGTRSFAILCVDQTAPNSMEHVNLTDREVPEDSTRMDFCHWILVNIPAETRELAEGVFSKGVTPKGKNGPKLTGKNFDESPIRQGINDYTHWFAGDHDMEGDYYGYDGPCPPWNDSLVHEYWFTVYALDVEEIQMPTDGKLNLNAITRRLTDHIIDSAGIVGRYTLNPRLVGGS